MENANLRKIYDRYWKTMSGFTHTGAEHSHNWSDGEVLEPSYTQDDAGRILDFAARLGVLSIAGLAQISTEPDLWKRVLEEARPLMPQRYGSAEQGGTGTWLASQGAPRDTGK